MEKVVVQGGAAVAPKLSAESQFISCQSPAIRAVERAVDNVATTRVPVLILGEAGTGKRSFGLRIHELSASREEPLHEFACNGLPADFFSVPNGVSHGHPIFHSFTGTVLLKEIGDLASGLQGRLMHLLADSTLDRGTMLPRLIACSSRNLEEEIRSGRFREDLYYRISGVCLRIPPVRHRREDIPVLVQHFLAKYSSLLSRSTPVLSDKTMRVLCEHSWPGNVRELENAVKAIAAIGDERVAMAALQSTIFERRRRNGDSAGLSLKEASRAASRQAEKELILKVLSRTRWNRKRAAEELRISYKALLYKLKQIGVDDDLNVNLGEEL